MKKIIFGFIFGAFCLTLSAQVRQDAFNGTRQKVGGGNGSAFNQARAGNFNDYRQKLNAAYVSKTREKWKSFNSFRAMALPDRDIKPVTPIRMSDEDVQRDRQDKELDIEDVIRPIHKDSTPPTRRSSAGSAGGQSSTCGFHLSGNLATGKKA